MLNEEFYSILAEKSILIAAVIGVSLIVAMYSTWAERKVAAFIQDRKGPNRAGIFGLLQPLADGLKLFSKEEIIPTHAAKLLFVLGPAIAMMVACIMGAVIPWSSPFEIGGKIINPQVAQINIGILYIFGVISIGIYGIMIGAWASNNKWSLMGGLRGASQTISYELPMGIALISVLMVTGTLELGKIVDLQLDKTWNFFWQPLGFLVFLICAFAETNRTPFDLPETENELIGGYTSEYSSMKLGFYLFAEYINMFTSSAVMATLYFGGYDIPFINDGKLGEMVGINWLSALHLLMFFIKIIGFILFFMWVRWTIPRFRYDQLMNLGWKKLIPLALFNMLITGAIILTFFNK